MIDMAKQTVQGVPIVRWECWWRTIKGLHKTVEEAIQSAHETEMSPDMIRSVPVALGANGEYEERYQ